MTCRHAGKLVWSGKSLRIVLKTVVGFFLVLGLLYYAMSAGLNRTGQVSKSESKAAKVFCDYLAGKTISYPVFVASFEDVTSGVLDYKKTELVAIELGISQAEIVEALSRTNRSVIFTGDPSKIPDKLRWPATLPADEAEYFKAQLTAATKPTTEPAVELLKPVWLPKGPGSP